MNASQIIEYAENAGMKLVTDGYKITVHNSDLLTDDLRQEIRLHKPEIIQLLSANQEYYRLTDSEVAELLQKVCKGIKLDPQQFWSFLDESDIADIRAGAISLDHLRAFAASWARYPELVPIGNIKSFPALNEAEPVRCVNCKHFTHDAVGNGGGIGQCATNAPVSFPRYPRAERFCQEFISQHQGGTE